MPVNADASWAKRTAKANLADPHFGWLGLPFRRHSEISLPRFIGSWAVCEDRHPLAAGYGPVCRSG